MQILLEPVREYFPLIPSALRVVAILLGAMLAMLILRRMFDVLQGRAVDLMVRRGQAQDEEMEKRARTVMAVIRHPVLILLWSAAVLMMLQEMGFSVGPLLAGAGLSAGVVGVAVGFGAQTLIKDIIAGIFILAENQIRVGDVAVINGTGGLVEEINLRTTVLRSENGGVHVFPNGAIQTLANLTREFAFWVSEVPVRWEQDADRAMGLMRETAEELLADGTVGPSILAPLELMGVDRFLPAGVMIKARLKTLPLRQWLVGREFNRRLQLRFRAAGIELPETSVVRLEGGGKEELKQAVREVLAEMRATGGKAAG